MDIIKEFTMEEDINPSSKENFETNHMKMDEENPSIISSFSNCKKLSKQNSFELVQREGEETDMEDEMLSLEVLSATNGKMPKEGKKSSKSNKKRRGRPSKR